MFRTLIGAVFFAAAPAAAAGASPYPYAAYQPLIGEWDVGSQGAPPAAIARFKWGPNKSYIWMSYVLLMPGGETPHLEGMLVWNGVTKTADILLESDLRSGLFEERGTFDAKPGGSFVRNIEGVYAAGAPAATGPIGEKGATAKFRQDFTPQGPDRFLTNALRWDGKAWVSTFPGSDRLVMSRRRAPN